MKKYASALSAVALILTMIICFSGCGIVDFARSAIQKNKTEVSTGETTQVYNSIYPGNQSVTNSATNSTIVIPSVSGGSTSTQAPTNNSYGSNSGVTTPTTPQQPEIPTLNSDTTQETQTQADKEPETQVTQTESSVETTAKNEEITEEQLEELSVKELQDLLFATKDPNTAGKILEIAGFEYDEEQGIYYSQMNPLQRKFGFNLVYDMAAPMVGMVYDTKRIEFNYDNREWMIQLWKGQYGMTSGAEIGLYNRDPSRNFQYDCADDEDLIEMQFDFYNQNEFVFSRGPEKHWWLTGFKVFHIGVPILIDLDMKLKFTDKQMAQAFAQSLRTVAATSLLDPIKYEIKGSTVTIKW